jgi:hypothetical protein
MAKPASDSTDVACRTGLLQWQRFWVPRTGGVIDLSDGGFLVDPTSPYAGRNSHGALHLKALTILHGLFDFPLLLQPQLALEQSDATIWWLGLGLIVAGIATLAAARIVYLARRSQTTIYNSFTHGMRFQNHAWRATGIIAVILFIAGLPILGLVKG